MNSRPIHSAKPDHETGSRRRPSILAKTAAIASAVVGLAAAGCGETPVGRVPVHKTAGTISFEGQTPDGAFVVLHRKQPAGGDAPGARGRVRPDGTFDLTTYETGDGAPAGEFVVTVEWRKLEQVKGEYLLGPNLLPPRYSKPATSDLVVRVADGQTTLPPLLVRRK